MGHATAPARAPTPARPPCPPSPADRRIVPAARRGEVAVEDLPLPSAQQAEPAYAELNKNWSNAVTEAQAAGKEPKLLKVRRRRFLPLARRRRHRPLPRLPPLQPRSRSLHIPE